MRPFGEYPLCLRRRKKSELFTMTPCLLRRLTMEDKDEALKLHRAVARNAHPEIFVAGSDEDFLNILEGRGVVLGIQEGDRIVCMRTVLFESHDEDLIREDMGLLPDQRPRMAFVEYCIVHQDFRGNNLQYLTYCYMENFLWDDFDYFCTTVSPHNLYSLNNVLSCGFYAFRLKPCYGGYMRYLLRKDLKHAPSIRTKKHVGALVSDYGRQQEFLESGMVGYRLIHHHSGVLMRFGTLIR